MRALAKARSDCERERERETVPLTQSPARWYKQHATALDGPGYLDRQPGRFEFYRPALRPLPKGLKIKKRYAPKFFN